MRLLHIVRSAHAAGGGVIEAVKQLAAAQGALGHQVEMISLDSPFSLAGETEGERVIGIGRKSSGYGFSLGALSELKRRGAHCDAVIVHGVWQFQALAAWRVFRDSTIPYYVFPHGMLDPWFQRTYPVKHVKKWIYWKLVEHRVFAGARRIFYTSEEEQRQARMSFSPNRVKEEIVPLGLRSPPADCARQRKAFEAICPQANDSELVLFLGRLHEKKGVEMLIEAAAEVAGRVRPIHLMLAGPASSPRYAEMVRQRADEMVRSLPQRLTVSFPGMLSGDAKWGALRAAKVFILPSHQENFGMAVVEALACGVPVLISDKVNIWREIEQDDAGLVENDDLPGTKRLLQRWLAKTDSEREQMGVAARRCYQRRFEIEMAVARLQNILEADS